MEKSLNKRNVAFLDATNPVVDVYDFGYDDDHVLHVVKTGQRDIQQEIQSYADSCGMEFVLKSLSAGDTSVLNAGGSGSYGDFSGAPQSLAQVQVVQEKASSSLSSLPDEIKNGRSAEQIIQLTGDQLNDLINKAVARQLNASQPAKELNKENE